VTTNHIQWVTPGHVSAGIAAGFLGALETYANDLKYFDTAFDTYTPVVSGFTTVITPYNTGRCLRAGKFIVYEATVQIGTIIVLGSSTVSVSLPVPASASTPATAIMGAVTYQNSSGQVFLGYAMWSSATTVIARVPASSSATNVSTWTGAVPAGQSTGDLWTFAGVYEAA